MNSEYAKLLSIVISQSSGKVQNNIVEPKAEAAAVSKLATGMSYTKVKRIDSFVYID